MIIIQNILYLKLSAVFILEYIISGRHLSEPILTFRQPHKFKGVLFVVYLYRGDIYNKYPLEGQ